MPADNRSTLQLGALGSRAHREQLRPVLMTTTSSAGLPWRTPNPPQSFKEIALKRFKVDLPRVKTPELPSEEKPAKDLLQMREAGLDTCDLAKLEIGERGVKRVPLQDSDILGSIAQSKHSDSKRLNQLLFTSSYAGQFTGCIGASPPRSLYEIYGPKKRAQQFHDQGTMETESRPDSQEFKSEAKSSKIKHTSKIKHSSAMQLVKSTHLDIYKDPSSMGRSATASTLAPSKFISGVKSKDRLGDPTSRSSTGAMDFHFPTAKQLREMERKMVQQCLNI